MNTTHCHNGSCKRVITVVVLFGLLGATLLVMDRILWCSCGTVMFWVNDSASSHTSQHLFDPYSFSHFQHGLLFFGVLYLLKYPRLEWALIIETIWEIAENTPWVIARYRAETVSLNYTGDSVVNSLGDLLSCLVGFWIASKLSWRASLILYAVIEGGMLLLIRDSLILNVVMLVWPLESIRIWQAG